MQWTEEQLQKGVKGSGSFGPTPVEKKVHSEKKGIKFIRQLIEERRK